MIDITQMGQNLFSVFGSRIVKSLERKFKFYNMEGHDVNINILWEVPINTI